MTNKTFDLSLYLIVGPSHVEGDLDSILSAAVEGGVSLVQVRDKRPSTADQIAYAEHVQRIVRRYPVPLLINDRVDVALAIGADGVHLGREDMEPETARRLLGPDAIIGITIKSMEEASAVNPDVIDYGSVGGVFPTCSKKNADTPIGLDGLSMRLKEISRRAPGLPVCAIAGIDEERAEQVMETGIQGISVISAITQAEDPKQAANRLRQIVKSAKHANHAASGEAGI